MNENLGSCGPTLECRLICKLVALEFRDMSVKDPVGLEGATSIRGGCIVLSEWRRPGRLA